ncbi:unnamed protein product, partial [Citrullus colocynthis]
RTERGKSSLPTARPCGSDGGGATSVDTDRLRLAKVAVTICWHGKQSDVRKKESFSTG